MFAVPGWSVTASSLKTQTHTIPKISADAAATGKDPDAKSKKRKRGEKGETVAAVTDANVGELWGKHLEGKKEKRVREKKDRKRPKTDGEASAGNPAESVTNGDATIKSTGKAAESVVGAAETASAQTLTENPPKKPSRKERRDANAAKSADQIASTVPPPAKLPATTKLTPMQSAMRQKLISARFRHLNETLYTAPSATALALFDENPEMFDDYHSGFRQQVTTWPENPVDNFIRMIQERGKASLPNQNKMFRNKKRNKEPEPAVSSGVAPLPRTHGTCYIADLGCGDARLAADLQTDGSTQKHVLKIASYDLTSNNAIVTKADIANLPLADGSMDVAIFCLALMGTNWIDFIEEAYRILHWKGELWIAEIKSRFGRVGGDKGRQKVVEHSVGSKRKLAAKIKAAETDKKKKDEEVDEMALQQEVDGVEGKSVETDVGGFVEVLRRRGFVLKDDKAVDLSNRMFVKMEFIKAAAPVVGKNVQEEKERPKRNDEEKGLWKQKPKAKFLENTEKEVSVEDEAKTLKPCLYKIR